MPFLCTQVAAKIAGGGPDLPRFDYSNRRWEMADRTVGNFIEQTPFFLGLLWTYALFISAPGTLISPASLSGIASSCRHVCGRQPHSAISVAAEGSGALGSRACMHKCILYRPPLFFFARNAGWRLRLCRCAVALPGHLGHVWQVCQQSANGTREWKKHARHSRVRIETTTGRNTPVQTSALRRRKSMLA